MKPKLLIAILISSLSAFAQSPINEYYGHLDTGIGADGNSHRIYYVLTSSTPLDQSATGANVTWNFDQLSLAGTSFYDNVAPTADEMASYPNTTIVTINTTTVGLMTTVSQAYFDTSGATAFTGVQSTDLNLSYTNNAIIGDFPLTYGYTNTDAVVGTYSYTTYSGTFTGTITSEVDAYGTLITNDFNGTGIQNDPVTRLKVTQILNLNLGIIPNVGTVTLTNYHYYRAGDNFPFFTSADTTIDVPLLGLNQSATALESAVPVLLGTPSFTLVNKIVIAPNPVNDQLSVLGNDLPIRSLEITDVNGRIVGRSNNNVFNTSTLSKGAYFVKVETDSGTTLKKFIKN
jgi:hypothetical protein